MMETKQETKDKPRKGFGKNIKPILVVSGAIVLLVLIMAFIPARDRKKDPNPEEPVVVSTLKVEPKIDFQDKFSINGLIEPDCVVEVAAEVSARVDEYARVKDKRDPKTFKRIPGPKDSPVLEEGDLVQEDQPLIYLNRELVEAVLSEVRATVEFQEEEFKRIEKLYKQNVATRMELEQAMMNRNRNRALLQTAEANMKRAIVVAPKGGVLNKLPADVGEYVRAGDVVAEIVDMSQVKIVVDIPERDIGYLSLGEDVGIKYGPRDQKQLTGKITYISKVADPASLTTRVEITVPNPEEPDGHRRLYSGQIVKLRILRRILKEAVLIPLRAVVPTVDDRNNVYHIVYVVENGKAEKRQVVLDETLLKGDEVGISKGIKGGEELILNPGRVSPGQLIEVEHPRPATTQPSIAPQISAKSQTKK